MSHLGDRAREREDWPAQLGEMILPPTRRRIQEQKEEGESDLFWFHTVGILLDGCLPVRRVVPMSVHKAEDSRRFQFDASSGSLHYVSGCGINYDGDKE